MIQILAPTAENFAFAHAHLVQGHLIGLPTETVYGLAGDAANPEAVASIFALKNRPSGHPLIVHIARLDAIHHWCAPLSKQQETWLERLSPFLPGPLTLVLPCARHVLPAVCGGQDSIALRLPAHPVAQTLLGHLQNDRGGLAAPSANRFGQISPTTASHVAQAFTNPGDETRLALILDGGPCPLGVESTILNLCATTPQLLRPGLLSAERLSAALDTPVVLPLNQAPRPRTPGSHHRHYAPRTPTTLVAPKHLVAYLMLHRNKRLGLVSHLPELVQSTLPTTRNLILPSDEKGYAHKLYAALHELDNANLDTIVVVAVPASWTAISDRLTRASKTMLARNE